MSYWKEKLKIGSLSFPRFLGGPLDGVTDSPFRQLVREFSDQELLYTEMRHVACVVNDRGRSLAFEQKERPLNFQVTANKIECIEAACEKILQKGVDCVDLNVGCPARRVVGSGSGSALMGDEDRLEEILRIFRQKLEHVPFTVKIRAGFDKKNAIDIAKMIQDCGADAIAIHPRLKTQKFSGEPDYKLAAEVKKALSIPVIFSGGVVDWESAKHVYEQTGVDGFLIGRGIWSKPWKLKELGEHSVGREYQVEQAVVWRCIRKHLENMITYYGPKGVHMFKKHVSFYIKGFDGAGTLRRKLVLSNSVEEFKRALDCF